MKKSMRFIIIAVAVYLMLLFLLLSAEAKAAGASIRSFGDALWYSLITMTTVGYGDVSPVTPLGRLLGAVFALCSVGILAAVIGVGVQLIGGTFIPRQRLRMTKGKNWYAFVEDSPEAEALAKALRKSDPGCTVIFPAGKGAHSGGRDVQMDFDAALLARLKGGKNGLRIFCMGHEPWNSYSLALQSAEMGIESYCMADIAAEDLPPKLHLFSPNDTVSRFYWTMHPLQKEEHTVVFIGGALCGALLERALLTNVFEQGRSTEYHVFGNAADFAALHPEIIKAMSGDKEGDSLTFYSEGWTQARELLARADRILICCDSDQENCSISEKLRSWYVVHARVHIRLKEPVAGIESFGGLNESFTPEYVMKDELNRRAKLMNDIYNEGAAHPTEWQSLSFFLRQSNIAAADHLIVKARYLLGDDSLTELSREDCRKAGLRFAELREKQADMLQEMEHRRWMRFYRMYNWKYAPVRDDRQRLHPLLVDYSALSPEDRRKDAYAWEMLERLAKTQAADEAPAE